MTSTIKVIAYPQSSVTSIYPSHVYAGLFSLKKKGLISLSYATNDKIIDSITVNLRNEPGEHGQKYGRCVVIKIISSGAEKIIFFDLADGPALECPSALGFCDVYFKRAYSPELHENEKIKPYGLYYTVSQSSIFNNLSLSSRTCLNRKWPIKQSLREIYKSLRGHPHPTISDFHHTPTEIEKNTKVLFQTRLFDAPSKDHFHASINDKRVSLMEALRDELGDNFHGGATDSSASRKLVKPDLITNKGSVRDWISQIKASSICISTEGIGGTNPDKLAIYLSMGRCIVSQRLNHTIPEPLTDGQNIHFFDSNSECIEKIKYLIDNPVKVYETQQKASEYFMNYANPVSTVYSCLERSK